jgi:hypothetical protein
MDKMLASYCENRQIEFTRSRVFKVNQMRCSTQRDARVTNRRKRDFRDARAP